MKKAVIAHANNSSGASFPIDAAGKSLVVKEWTGSGPDYLHVHHEDDEAWHILEGSLSFHFGKGDTRECGPGTTVFVPAGVPHSYVETSPSRYLIIMTPRLDELISALHKVPLTSHAEIMKRYKSEILE